MLYCLASRTELLMDLPVGDDAPKGRVPLIILLRDHKSLDEPGGRIFHLTTVHLTLNTIVRFSSFIAAPGDYIRY